MQRIQENAITLQRQHLQEVDMIAPTCKAVRTSSTKQFQTHTRKKRCMKCSKKVGIFGFTCKCCKMFCAEHALPESHDCTYDFKTEARERLRMNNPKVVAQKVDFI